MEHIRPIVYVNSDTSIKGYGILDFSSFQSSKIIEDQLKAPYMILFIEPSEDGANIRSVRAIYHNGEQQFSVVLNSEIQNVGLFLNSETLKEGTLADKVSQYLSFYNVGDISALLIPPISDTSEGSSIISTPSGTILQQGIDAFVIEIAGYLAALNFLLEDDVYRTLPFHFTLPYYAVNENVLNTNMFKYI